MSSPPANAHAERSTLTRVDRLLLGLFGTMVVMFIGVVSAGAVMYGELMGQLVVMQGDFNRQFNELNGRVIRLEERITVLDDRMTVFEERLTRLEERVTRLEERVSGIEERVSGIEAVLRERLPVRSAAAGDAAASSPPSPRAPPELGRHQPGW